MAQYTGLLRRRERRMHRGVTVLTYHRVLPDARCADAPLPGLVMPASAFAEQARWLATHCRVVTVAQAMYELREHGASFGAGNGHSHARPTVALSFDDGYRDNFEHAHPILREHELVATFFVTAGLIGGDKALWFDIAARAWRHWDAVNIEQAVREATGASFALPTDFDVWMESLKQMGSAIRASVIDALTTRDPAIAAPGDDGLMDWPMLAQLIAHGHEIGAHSMTHELLPQLDDPALDHETGGAHERLQSKLDTAITGFCYPNGDHDPRVAEAVHRAGYAYACTTRPGLNESGADPMHVARMEMTAHRLLDRAGRWDALGFRSELCGLREVLR